MINKNIRRFFNLSCVSSSNKTKHKSNYTQALSNSFCLFFTNSQVNTPSPSHIYYLYSTTNTNSLVSKTYYTHEDPNHKLGQFLRITLDDNLKRILALSGITLGALLYSFTFNPFPTNCEEPSFYKAAKKSFENSIPYRREGLLKIVKYLGPEKFSCNQEELEDLSTDGAYLQGKIPDIITFPSSTQDVSEILKVCNEYDIPVVPYGSGTSLEANTTTVKGGVVINMSRMRNIKNFSTQDSDITVEPGISWMELNSKIAHSGLFFPVDPGPGASIGGMISTRCSGTNAIRYGVIKDWVLSLTVVLIDGTIMKVGTKARKDAAGYDFVRLFCGADGTLGVITEATLKLTPIPSQEYIVVCSFPSIKAACDSVLAVVQKGVLVGCAELLDPDTVVALNMTLDKPLKVSPCIMFKFTGTKAQVEDAVRLTKPIALSKGGQDFQYFTPETGALDLWESRKSYFTNYLATLDADIVPLATDVCVPIGKMPEFAEMIKRLFSVEGITTHVLGHVGDGNIHLTAFYRKDKATYERLKKLYHEMINLAIKIGGTCTGEHGVGVGKREFLKNMYPKETIDMMKKVKKVFDPKGLMNPEKVFLFE